MKVEIKNGDLVITIPMNNPPRSSASGKSLLVATTSGPLKSDLLVEGKPVVVVLSAYIKN